MRAKEFIVEISDETLQSYLGKADRQISNRLDRMSQARERLNKNYEIYDVENPTRIIDRFEANSPELAREYYYKFIKEFNPGDQDFHFEVRRSTGIMDEDISRRGFLGGMLGTATGLGMTDAEAAKKKTLAKPIQHDKDAKAMSAKIDSKYQLAKGDELPVLSNNPRVEIAVQKAAKAHGITHPAELAQFMAQTNHESWDFTKLYQVGDKRVYGGKGLIQLTGKQNYAAASKFVGIDLVKHPEQAANLNVALKIAIWFWKEEVRRYAKTPQQFMDTRLITRIVNGPDMNGLKDRNDKFKRYLDIL